MKKIISFALALLAALSTASFAVFADGEDLKSPNPVPGRANPTGNILEFDDLTGAAPKGGSGYAVNTQEEVKTDDGWTLAFDVMVEAHEPGNNGQLAQFVFSPDGGNHWMAYCFSRKHVAFEISYAGWPTYPTSAFVGYGRMAMEPFDWVKGTWYRIAMKNDGNKFSIWCNGKMMTEYEFTDDDLMEEGRQEVMHNFILFYPTNLTMYLDNIVTAAWDFDVATETGTIFDVITFDGDAENSRQVMLYGPEPAEGEEDTRIRYDVYEEAKAEAGKDRPRAVCVTKEGDRFIYENVLNNETGEYESRLVPFDKSVEIVPAYCVVTKSDNWSFPGGTGAYEIIKLEHEILLGDGTNDGKVNMSDIIMAIRSSLSYKIDTLVNVDALDVNRDGKVDTRDIIILVRYANNYTQNVPVGQPISSLTA